MNRTDRLLALLLELQRQQYARSALDLAQTFEISKRTIYRDIQALCEAGVPVIATPGQGYTLDENYFLPPLRFTPDEATLLLIGVEFMAQNFDAQYRAAADSAGRKIEAVLPKASRAEVAYLRANIRFIAAEIMGNPALGDKLRALRGAIIARHSVRFRYHARYTPEGRASQRELNPYSLAYMSGAWYITGYDHARRDQRTFRLDRMEGLSVLSKIFTRPPDWKFERRDQDRVLTVRVFLSQTVARWAQESRPYYWVSEVEEPGGVMMTLQVRHEDEVFNWILSWGRHACVVEPASLRDRLALEAEQMAALYQLNAD